MLGRLVEERWEKLLMRFMINLATLIYVPIATRSLECISHIRSYKMFSWDLLVTNSDFIYLIYVAYFPVALLSPSNEKLFTTIISCCYFLLATILLTTHILPMPYAILTLLSLLALFPPLYHQASFYHNLPTFYLLLALALLAPSTLTHRSIDSDNPNP